MALVNRELAVIGDDLLSTLLKEQAPKHIKDYDEYDDGRIKSNTKHCDYKELRIEYLNVLKISNLESFTQLNKLQLSNNLIERIENLDKLVNLTWLDLSYNNIEVIEGLETLVHLADLSLQHNKIEKVEGLEALDKLDVLSLGDNDIRGADEVARYFRGLTSTIRSLSFSNNPVCEEEDYDKCIIAYLPTLRYLDWVRVTEETRSESNALFVDDLEKVRLIEDIASAKVNTTVVAEAKRDKFINGLMPNMYDDIFWNTLHTTNAELDLLATIPGIQEELRKFRAVVIQQTTVIGEKGIEIHTVREEECRLIREAIETDVIAAAAQSAIEAEELHKLKDEAVEEATSDDSPGSALALEHLHHLMADQKDKFLNREISLQFDCEEIIGIFDRTLQDLNQNMIELVNESMATTRKAEEDYFNALSARVTRFFEGYARGVVADEEFEVSEELHTVLRDKESINNVCTTAHDKQVFAIDAMEELLGERMASFLKTHVDGLKQTEHTRNRSRVVEIMANAAFFNDDIDSILESM